ncbi:MAG: tetratricopeptide repeat protein, partial [Candidatus Omnitrophica bacterium]|nr:tetratricopeptide repeat protein [Candidatus Omnitrophota bacterium]
LEKGMEAEARGDWDLAVRRYGEGIRGLRREEKRRPHEENRKKIWRLEQEALRLYERLERYDEAAGLLREAIAGVEKTGAPHPEALASLKMRFAGVLVEAGRWQEAEKTLLEAMGSLAKVKGTNSRERLAVEERLALVTYLELKFEESLFFYGKLIEQYARLAAPPPGKIRELKRFRDAVRRSRVYIEKRSKEKSGRFVSRMISHEEARKWVVTHSLMDHPFQSVLGNKRGGMIRDLNEMPHPPYVVKHAVKIGPQDFAWGADPGEAPSRLARVFAVDLSLWVAPDEFKEIERDLETEGIQESVLLDYLQVLGWALAGLFDRFPEIVDGNRLIVFLNMTLREERSSAESLSEGGEVAMQVPIEVRKF